MSRLQKCQSSQQMTDTVPVLYMILQSLTLGTMAKNCNCMLNFDDPWNILLYIDILFMLLFFMLTSCRDPGYLVGQEIKTELKKVAEHPGTLQTANMRSERQFNRVKQDNNFDLECEASIDEDHVSKIERPAEGTNTVIETSKKFSSQVASPSSSIVTKQNAYSFAKIQMRGRLSFNQSQSPKEQENQFELRYCTTCNQEQMLRAKHCSTCGRCVAMYDHHCPWVGNCIGERNKGRFYWFLVFQLVELVLGGVKVNNKTSIKQFLLNVQIDRSRILDAIMAVAALMVIAFFTIMVSLLLSYHLYIAAINQTTWEHVSWYKISYLKDYPQSMGSPFSKGMLNNLKLMCRLRVDELTNWHTSPQS